MNTHTVYSRPAWTHHDRQDANFAEIAEELHDAEEDDNDEQRVQVARGHVYLAVVRLVHIHWPRGACSVSWPLEINAAAQLQPVAPAATGCDRLLPGTGRSHQTEGVLT